MIAVAVAGWVTSVLLFTWLYFETRDKEFYYWLWREAEEDVESLVALGRALLARVEKAGA